ncbi:hypothetical protein HK104_001616 [Borealophlyctis nickersoniae]|nr:hypothetical protein HK104_001616 [Borealophlyctis nickersoniae]
MVHTRRTIVHTTRKQQVTPLLCPSGAIGSIKTVVSKDSVPRRCREGGGGDGNRIGSSEPTETGGEAFETGANGVGTDGMASGWDEGARRGKRKAAGCNGGHADEGGCESCGKVEGLSVGTQILVTPQDEGRDSLDSPDSRMAAQEGTGNPSIPDNEGGRVLRSHVKKTGDSSSLAKKTNKSLSDLRSMGQAATSASTHKRQREDIKAVNGSEDLPILKTERTDDGTGGSRKKRRLTGHSDASRSSVEKDDTPEECARRRTTRRKLSAASEEEGSGGQVRRKPLILSGECCVKIANDDEELEECSELPVTFRDNDIRLEKTLIDIPAFEIMEPVDVSRSRARTAIPLSEDVSDEAYLQRHKRLEFSEKRAKNREKELLLHQIYKRSMEGGKQQDTKTGSLMGEIGDLAGTALPSTVDPVSSDAPPIQIAIFRPAPTTPSAPYHHHHPHHGHTSHPPYLKSAYIWETLEDPSHDDDFDEHTHFQRSSTPPAHLHSRVSSRGGGKGGAGWVLRSTSSFSSSSPSSSLMPHVSRRSTVIHNPSSTTSAASLLHNPASAGPGQNVRRSLRISMPFGCPMPPMAERDMDVCVELAQVLCEAGIGGMEME